MRGMEKYSDIRGCQFLPEELVSYQEGSVVSRTLIEQNGGTITLFAFDSGQALSEHMAPYEAFVQIIDGEAEIIIDGQPNAVSRGSFLIMPANVPHSVRANERFKMILTMVRG